ncbi:phosphoribosylaminoimidazole-succinocarboxamide synthase [Rhizophagus irregularis]|uniref:Phosphoribosylaminoimidazole-succinocarboxamide synthase n=4 Tax=Rhizophagus irregularis TaxID=588596 RepID=U9U732_RHIID|nr:phosphoribosylaminoimidazole-succinocarboxamide synthase [Rhizophagus irregularis DAOM 181602=DAOM 197198]EXX59409.1 phosphoribosylaminoimidazolesuccinocarboxamide synthase [Rhizophagus irregularis DAOM 197198w]PKC73752.1 phosphoribosylaminoimidazole-succinocarboxamide synthase [Rhizophagus irregularis]PKY22100.1 phosphoribosylaminoimidazole-succinocarboxamide synthase [Rhizophagus irregularis]POG61586.1 phosphoribosylaminoimidazole-succinocarboxamide synthase [Rhizophagus irregularis DAOM 1|eukprot:XP_025168452.1 phosphoribosylaminoimidazole-succinocarboxamide synthase [Rhizophagus irregularis DAOM 181602=DAOM 197198]
MALLKSSCPDLELITCGKVRDLYRIDDNTLLFVATDRISAFDVIMKNGVPGKGKLLTQMSVFWFNYLKDILPNHIITTEFDQMPEKVQKYRDQLEYRCLLVKKLKVFSVEAIVRGYITGSAWSEYKKKGTVCDITLPEGLKESQSFEKALYTPSTKAEIGQHDENIHPSKVPEIIGDKYADQISEISVKLYTKAKEYALSKGIIIADTKFEFGRDDTGILYLVDEVLTPDSSRFWLSLNYEVGKSQESFDKQYLRNYLLSIDFDKKTSIELPNDIITKTMERYIETYKMITDSDPTFL